MHVSSGPTGRYHRRSTYRAGRARQVRRSPFVDAAASYSAQEKSR